MVEMYRHMSIEVDRHQSYEEDEDERHLWKVEDGLKRFFLPTQLEAKCEKCKTGTTITRENKIASRYVNFLSLCMLLPLSKFVEYPQTKSLYSTIKTICRKRENSDQKIQWGATK